MCIRVFCGFGEMSRGYWEWERWAKCDVTRRLMQDRRTGAANDEGGRTGNL